MHHWFLSVRFSKNEIIEYLSLSCFHDSPFSQFSGT